MPCKVILFENISINDFFGYHEKVKSNQVQLFSLKALKVEEISQPWRRN